MKQYNASFDIDRRRASVRRTAVIAGAIAVTIFVLFFLKAFWH